MSKVVKKSVPLLLIIFLLADVGIGAYIFTKTTREKTPEGSFPLRGVDFFDLSSGGEVAAIGYKNTVSYLQMNKRENLWEYTLDSEVTAVSISSNTKFVATSDANNNLYLIFRGVRNNPNLIFKQSIDKKIEKLDLYCVGDYFYVLRLVVFTKDSIYLFSLDEKGPLWSYTLEEEITTPKLSYNGKWIVAGTASGNLYLFSTFKQELTKEYSLNSEITSLSISPYGDNIFVGCKNGSAFMMSSEKGLLWQKNMDSKVVFTSTNIKGRKSFLKTKNGNFFLFNEEGDIIRTFKNEKAVPHFSQWTSNFVLVEGATLRYFKEDRETPVWVYRGDTPPRKVSSNMAFDEILAVYDTNFDLFTKDYVLILGSREAWSLLAILVLLQVAICLYLPRKEMIDIQGFIKSQDFRDILISTVIGGAVGVAFVYRFMKTYVPEIIVLVIAVSIFSSWNYIISEKGKAGIILGWIYGVFASVILGALIGIFMWLGGTEQSIFTTMAVYAFVGVFTGILIGLVAAVATAVVDSFFE